MIRSGRKSVAAAALSIAAIVFASSVAAKIVFTGSDDKPAGRDSADVKAFQTMLDDCAAKSPAFKAYVRGTSNQNLKDKSPKGGLDQDKETIDIKLVRDGSFIDDAESRGGKGKITVNLSNLERLPDPDIVKGKSTTPPGTAWGMTRCELIMHFLSEARRMITNNAEKPQGDPHDYGVQQQRLVRNDFGQGPESRCNHQRFANDTDPKDKIPSKTITYKDKDGREQTITPDNQIQVSYGPNDLEVLWFDKSGKLQLAFFHNGKQIPRDQVILPKDDPAKHYLNPEYAIGPDGAGSSASFAVNADCDEPPGIPAATPPPAPKPQCSSGGGFAGVVNDIACQEQHG
ncbi:MAG: hypothetical protein ISQ86_05530 [Alphaproteobacteria bacterium]|nr:hypothetical protein [Alphaproteobacteria bacterium]